MSPQQAPSIGPWEEQDWGDPTLLDGVRARYLVCDGRGNIIAYVFDEADMRLIAEAGTASHLTGVMPLRLAGQRDSLLSAAEAVLSSAFAADYRRISPFKELAAAVSEAKGATA